MLGLHIRLELRNYLNWVAVLGLRSLPLNTVLRREQVALRGSDLRMVTLHLNLLVGVRSAGIQTWRNITHIHRRVRHLHAHPWVGAADRTAIMRSRSL